MSALIFYSFCPSSYVLSISFLSVHFGKREKQYIIISSITCWQHLIISTEKSPKTSSGKFAGNWKLVFKWQSSSLICQMRLLHYIQCKNINDKWHKEQRHTHPQKTRGGSGLWGAANDCRQLPANHNGQGQRWTNVQSTNLERLQVGGSEAGVHSSLWWGPSKGTVLSACRRSPPTGPTQSFPGRKL